MPSIPLTVQLGAVTEYFSLMSLPVKKSLKSGPASHSCVGRMLGGTRLHPHALARLTLSELATHCSQSLIR